MHFNVFIVLLQCKTNANTKYSFGTKMQTKKQSKFCYGFFFRNKIQKVRREQKQISKHKQMTMWNIVSHNAHGFFFFPTLIIKQKKTKKKTKTKRKTKKRESPFSYIYLK